MVAAAVALLATGASACSSSSKASPPASASTVPVVVVASAADLCHNFTNTFLQAARDHWSDAQAEAAYRSLANAGQGIDAATSAKIAALADAFATASTTSMSLKVSNATGAVLSACKRLGYPLTAAQLTELRNLLIQTFEPSTTTTTKP